MRTAWAILLATASACGPGSNGSGDPGEGGCGPVDPLAPRPNTLTRGIFEPATLKASCSPYLLEEPLTVQAPLTIEPGVTLLGCMGGCRSRVTVGREGTLVAAGTAEAPIVFSSIWRDDPRGPGRGNWTGILFLDSPPGSRLEHVVLEHGGGPFSPLLDDDEFSRYEFARDATLMVDSAEGIDVADVRIESSRGYALAVSTSDDYTASGKDVFARFDRVTVVDVEKGLWVPVDQAGTVGPDVCFGDRDAGGACPDGAAPAGVYVEAHLDDVLGRTPESVRRDATWHRYDAPWLAESINVENGARLTVEDGVELRMSGLGGIFVGLSGPGALDMQAAAPGGIRVRGLADAPAARERWDGLYLWSETDGAATRIVNVDLGFGGKRSPRIDRSAPALLGIYNDGGAAAQPTIRGVHVHDSLGAGIHWNCLAAPAGLEPTNEGNSADADTIACAAAIGDGIAENYNCGCPGACAGDRCPQPDP
jgi:hypothetical protein